MSDEIARWYLVHCKPREDERALEHLQRQNFRCYRPLRERRRLQQGRRVLTSESLFPRYLFIHLDSVQDNWYPIRSTRGVHQIVSFNGWPVPVQDEVIEQIRTRLARTEAEPCLNPGERVQIIGGAFSDVEGIFVANDGEERVVLLLNILQKEQRLSFPVGNVRKIL